MRLGPGLGRPGGDLLSHALRRSTIGAEGFHGRVRDGIGCFTPRHSHQAVQSRPAVAQRFQHIFSTAPATPFWGGRIQYFRVLSWSLGSLIRTRPCRTDAAHPGPRRSRARRGRGQADRAISTGQLHVLPRFHTRPIDVVVFHGSQARPGFEGGFPLRCFQRLSCPHLATRRCGWRHNRSTRGASIPVLSY